MDKGILNRIGAQLCKMACKTSRGKTSEALRETSEVWVTKKAEHIRCFEDLLKIIEQHDRSMLHSK